MNRRIAVLLAGTAGTAAILATASASSADAASHAATHRHAAHVAHLVIKGATHNIRQEIARVGHLQTRVARSHGLNDADKAALQAALTADRSALGDDLTALGTATTRAQVRGIVASAHRTADLAGRQVIVVVASDVVQARAATDAATLADLTSQVNAAALLGTDVTAELASLADMQTQLTTATTDAAAAVTTILAVAPDASSSTVRSAFHAAHVSLDAARTALDTAEADAAAVVLALA
jgi:trimeric autotransporter adhesin